MSDFESSRFADFLSTFDEEKQYRLRERCAIHVFDGGLTRAEAEDRTIIEADDQGPFTGELL